MLAGSGVQSAKLVSVNSHPDPTHEPGGHESETLSPREARVGREPESGVLGKQNASSPRPSPPSCVGRRGRPPADALRFRGMIRGPRVVESLPLGAGTGGGASLVVRATPSHGGNPPAGCSRTLLPLPAGEGRGEGEAFRPVRRANLPAGLGYIEWASGAVMVEGGWVVFSGVIIRREFQPSPCWTTKKHRRNVALHESDKRHFCR